MQYEQHPACVVGEGTGIDESLEGKRKKRAQALLDATRANDALETAKYKVREAESRVKFWTREVESARFS